MIDLYAFAKSLKSDNCEILVDSPMSRQTSFKVGGNADIIVYPEYIEIVLKTSTGVERSDFVLVISFDANALM